MIVNMSDNKKSVVINAKIFNYTIKIINVSMFSIQLIQYIKIHYYLTSALRKESELNMTTK